MAMGRAGWDRRRLSRPELPALGAGYQKALAVGGVDKGEFVRVVEFFVRLKSNLVGEIQATFPGGTSSSTNEASSVVIALPPSAPPPMETPPPAGGATVAWNSSTPAPPPKAAATATLRATNRYRMAGTLAQRWLGTARLDRRTAGLTGPAAQLQLGLADSQS